MSTQIIREDGCRLWGKKQDAGNALIVWLMVGKRLKEVKLVEYVISVQALN